MSKIELISLHGGHSGQYCNHAEDSLEDIIKKYIKLGFKKVGISEHMPPVNDHFLFPDEKEIGLTAFDINNRFEHYFKNINELKNQYASQISLFVGMETETYTGSIEHVKNLISKFQPDYIVGSVHHVDDVCFDYSKEEYDSLVLKCGSHDSMYGRYFDQQYEMILALKPFVIGHFDLIRIYDKNYKQRVLQPEINQKIIRNLELINSLNLVLDFNLRPLTRGEEEPYITSSILELAAKMGIRLVPGDDSHCVDQAGGYVDKAISIMKNFGFETCKWPVPELIG